MNLIIFVERCLKMKCKTIKRDNVEKVLNKYLGIVFDAIQDTLSKKEKSNDINLDIDMKIFSKSHQILLQLKRELIKLEDVKNEQ